jgi:hypothetical protein
MLIEARTKLPLAATVVPIKEHETLSLRALVTQARTNLAGHARLHKVVSDKGFLDGGICGGSSSIGSSWWSQPWRTCR